MKNIEINANDLAYAVDSSKILFRNVHFSYQEGDIICLLGNNGAGKSSLLKVCAGILSPTFGKYTISKNGVIIQNLSEILRLTAWLPQMLIRPEYFNVKEFLALKNPWDEGSDFFSPFFFSQDYVLNEFEISHLYHNELKQLSGGEWKRVQLARLWMNRAKVIFMDEPESDLDLKYKYLLAKFCKDYVKENKAIIFVVTHNLDFAQSIATQICALKDGLWVWNSKAEDFWRSNVFNKLYDI